MADRLLELKSIMWMFGMSQKEAQKYRKEASSTVIDEIVKCFIANAKKCFYED